MRQTWSGRIVVDKHTQSAEWLAVAAPEDEEEDRDEDDEDDDEDDDDEEEDDGEEDN